MIGAIIGDIVGSIYEFDNIKTKDFELFSKDCMFTDDTIMTIAVADALLKYNENTFKNDLIKVMHRYGKAYPDVGYGGYFVDWLENEDAKPYYSCGNGSAMRVSAVGWYANNLIEAEEIARATAEITHNHPEGIKGAQVVAGAIFLAKIGKDKEEIKEYTESNHYTLDFTLDEIRPTYKFQATCQKSVPQALQAFFESEDFEDAIRNAISIGGDSDTIAAITGAIAEAYYGIDEDIKETALSYLDYELLAVVDSFRHMIKERN